MLTLCQQVSSVDPMDNPTPSKDISCSGFVLFDTTHQYVAVVTTPHGNRGFPKGKRCKSDQSTLETAWRELREETGLTREEVFLPFADGVVFDEQKPWKRSISVRYFLGIYHGEWPRKLACEDANELDSVGWFLVSDLLADPKLADRRKTILQNCVTLLQSTQ